MGDFRRTDFLYSFIVRKNFVLPEKNIVASVANCGKKIFPDLYVGFLKNYSKNTSYFPQFSIINENTKFNENTKLNSHLQ